MVFGDLLNCLAEHISSGYGAAAWAQIARHAAGLDASSRWLPSQPFDDSLFDSLAAACAQELQQSEQSVLLGLGLYLIERMASDPRHARVVACLGSSFPELLAAGGLHFVHLHLDMYTRMLAAPGLHVSQQSAGSAVLRLRREGEGSACAGLGWVMAGAVRGVAHVFFNCGVVIEALGREQGHDGVEEEVFLLTFPPDGAALDQPSAPPSTSAPATDAAHAGSSTSDPGNPAASAGPGAVPHREVAVGGAAGVPADAGQSAGAGAGASARGGAAAGAGAGAGASVGAGASAVGSSPRERLMAMAHDNGVFAPSRQLFYCMHPFHFIVDQQCRLVQVGPKLLDLLPSMRQGEAVADTLKFEYPHVAFSFTTLKQLHSTPVLLRVWTPGGGPCCGLELMGEFLEVEVEAGAGARGAAAAAAGAVAAAREPAERKGQSNGVSAESSSGGGAASGSSRCMLFMGSPRISGLEELKKHKLSLADIPAFDMAREFMLLSDEYSQKMVQSAIDFSNLRVEVQDGLTFTSSSSSGVPASLLSPPPWGLFSNRSFNRSSAPIVRGSPEAGPFNPFGGPNSTNLYSGPSNTLDSMSMGPNLASMFSQGIPGSSHYLPSSRQCAPAGPHSGSGAPPYPHPLAAAAALAGVVSGSAPSGPGSGVGSGAGGVGSGGTAMTDASLALGMGENSADKAIQLLDSLLNGQQVSVAMIFEAREAMLSQASQRHPPQRQMRERLRFMGLDDDVNRSLLQLLDTDANDILDDAVEEGSGDPADDPLPDWVFDPSPPPPALPATAMSGSAPPVARRAGRALREPSFTNNLGGGAAFPGSALRRRSSVELLSTGHDPNISFDGFAAAAGASAGVFGSVAGLSPVPSPVGAQQRYVRLSSGALPRSGSTNSIYALAAARSTSSGRLGQLSGTAAMTAVAAAAAAAAAATTATASGGTASGTSSSTTTRDQLVSKGVMGDLSLLEGMILGEAYDSTLGSGATANVGAGASAGPSSSALRRRSAEGRLRELRVERTSSNRPSTQASANPSTAGAGPGSSSVGGAEQPPWFLATQSSLNLSSVLMSGQGLSHTAATPSNLQSMQTGSTGGTGGNWPQASQSLGGGMPFMGSFNSAAAAAADAAESAVAEVDAELAPLQRTNSRWASAAALTAELAQQYEHQLGISSGAHAAMSPAVSGSIPLLSGSHHAPQTQRSAGSGGLSPGEVLPLYLRQTLHSTAQSTGSGAEAAQGSRSCTLVKRTGTDEGQGADVWVSGSAGQLIRIGGEAMTEPVNSIDIPRFMRGSLPGELQPVAEDRPEGVRAGTARRRRMSTPLVPVISGEELRAILQKGSASIDTASLHTAPSGVEAMAAEAGEGAGGQQGQAGGGHSRSLPHLPQQVQVHSQAHTQAPGQVHVGWSAVAPTASAATQGPGPGRAMAMAPNGHPTPSLPHMPSISSAAPPAAAGMVSTAFGLASAHAPAAPAAPPPASVPPAVADSILNFMRQTDSLTVGSIHQAGPSSFQVTQSRLSLENSMMSTSGMLLVSSLEPGPSELSRLPLTRLYQSPSDQLCSLLSKVDEWRFNMFELAQATNGHALSVLGFALVKRCKAFRRHRMDETRLARYLIEVEAGYKGQHYHCSTHAADVLRTLHVLGTRGGVWQYSGCSEVSVLAMCLAAVIHDYGHRSVNNDFLVKTQDPLAVLYNDRSPMENHHVAAAWTLLKDERYNFLHNLPPKALESLRKVVIDVVLCTDMKQHFAMASAFSGKVMAMKSSAAANPYDSATPRTTEGPGTGRQTPIKVVRNERMRLSSMPAISVSPPTGPSSGPMLSTMPVIHPPLAVPHSPHLSGPGALGGEARDSGSGRPLVNVSGASLAQRSGGSFGRDSAPEGGSGSGVEALQWDEEDRLLVLQMALKWADLGHLTSPLDVHLQWVHRLEEEMFRQGDLERAHGLAVSPLMDRTRGPGITKSQTGFFNIVALPMYQSMALAFPNCSPMLSALRANLSYWSEREAHYSSSEQHTAV